MKQFFKQKNKGFTLVETLVAISIFTVSILGLLSVLSNGIANTGYAKQKMVAGYLAQEGIEYVRNRRDNYVLYSTNGDWNTFKANLSSIINYPVGDIDFSGFTRSISADTGFGDNEVEITSTVTWTQGSGNRSVTFSENLYNWVQQ